MLTRRDPKEFLFFTRTPNGREAAKEFLARLEQRTNDRDKAISVGSFRAQLKAIHRWGKQEPADLSSIHQPVLIMNGESDKMVPTKNTVDLDRRLPGQRARRLSRRRARRGVPVQRGLRQAGHCVPQGVMGMTRRRERRSVSGRVVAITGGARGIGHATAAALARQGARVAIGDLDADLAARVGAELGGDAFGVGVDVTDNAAFTAFLDGVEHRLGPLDVLVNNAGIMSRRSDRGRGRGDNGSRDRDQPGGGHPWHARGGAADEAATHGSHRQRLLSGEQGRGVGLRHLRARRSSASPASPRPSRSSFGEPASRCRSSAPRCATPT